MDDMDPFFAAGVAAPHPIAAAAGRDVLVEGGTVIEAALAAAMAAAVVAPARNGLGGDALWLFREAGPRGRTRALDARGAVAAAARPSFYRERGFEAVPLAGPAAVAAVPGAVAGWIEAHGLAGASGGRMPVARLLAPALAAARDGWEPSARDAPPPDPDAAPRPEEGMSGASRGAPALAATLEQLAASGLADFYRGDVARELDRDLAAAGSPLGRADLRAAAARWREPHGLELGRHALAAAPTRSGLLAGAALGLVAGLAAAGFDGSAADGFARWHGLIEALRAAEALVEAAEVEGAGPGALLDPARLARFALTLDRRRASRADAPPVPPLDEAAVWIGAVDRDGAAVSLVQTLGGAFGARTASGRTGVALGNRAAALALDPGGGPTLWPGRRAPLRSLPALLVSPRDGNVAAFGAAGEGAPAAVAQLADRLMGGMTAGAALAAARFALGTVPGGRDAAVLVEADREPGPVAALRSAGHQIAEGGGAGTRDAGAIVRGGTGRILAASDDGAAAGL